jgi:dynein heavy chain
MQALARINEQQALVEAARCKAVDLKAGMDIFSIPQPPYKELTSMETDLGKLSAIWTIVQDWEGSYNTWKRSKFKEIQVCFGPLKPLESASA